MSTKQPSCKLIAGMSKFCLEELQDIWNIAANNKLHAICPVVDSSRHNNLTSCEAVIINRLKIGHSRLILGDSCGMWMSLVVDTAVHMKRILSR